MCIDEHWQQTENSTTASYIKLSWKQKEKKEKKEKKSFKQASVDLDHTNSYMLSPVKQNHASRSMVCPLNSLEKNRWRLTRWWGMGWECTVSKNLLFFFLLNSGWEMVCRCGQQILFGNRTLDSVSTNAASLILLAERWHTQDQMSRCH